MVLKHFSCWLHTVASIMGGSHGRYLTIRNTFSGLTSEAYVDVKPKGLDDNNVCSVKSKI